MFQHKNLCKVRTGWCLLGLSLALVLGGASSAEESGLKGMWPFGKDDAEEQAAAQKGVALGDPALESALGEEPAKDDDKMFDTPFANATWPKVEMPKLKFPSPWTTEDGGEGWLAKPVNRTREGFHNAAEKTRTAMNSGIDKVKAMIPGGEGGTPDSGTQLADGSEEPGFWQKMFGPKNDTAAPEDPVEMMAREPAATQR